jgi:formamidopyrimidine-DNA glycosylase
MPELPEVETVARTLRGEFSSPPLVGRVIQSVAVKWRRELSGISPRAFASKIIGKRVTSVGRIGKYLVIELHEGRTKNVERTSGITRHPSDRMLVHLKMSGRLDVVPQSDAITKHARVVWMLDKGLALRFDDARKFGRVYLPERIEEVVGTLGPDALSTTEDDFVLQLKKKKGALKPILLDQSFVAGVGNIYADESLHLARLHPKRLASTIKENEARMLYAVIQRVLREAIEANGATFDWVYPGGEYQNNFRVYGRTDEPCLNCGHPIKRILVGQRSTHFCAKCQR